MNDDNPLVFPKAIDDQRIEQYRHYDRLFEGHHFEAFTIKGEEGFSKQYKKLRYIVANFPGLISRVMADMLFGESLTWDLNEGDNQTYIDGLFHHNDLMNQFMESALSNSRRGDDVFKIRIARRNPLVKDSQPEIIIEQVPPQIYFPQFDETSARNVATQDVIAHVFRRGELNYLHKETHQPGDIFHEVFLYDEDKKELKAAMDPKDFGYAEREETRINRSLVFHAPNFRIGKESGDYWGVSDYSDLESLFFAMNNRLTKTDNILDRHSDPILAVPPGVIDEEGKVKKEELGMFEVDNENPGFNKPEYIVWNANLDSAFKQIDRLIDLTFMFSEIAPATFGMDKDGQAESGRALKFKLLSTIRKRNRKLGHYDKLVKDLITTSLNLGASWGIPIDGVSPTADERPTIKWPDGIINDVVEQAEVADTRIASGTQSRAAAIAQMDGVTPEEAEEKVKEIDAEQLPTVTAVENNTNGNQPPANQEE